VHERFRQTDRQTDDRQTTNERATAYSECEFTFAKNETNIRRIGQTVTRCTVTAVDD